MSQPVNASFDYVVVGGGTAGCVIARRLADSDASVCLLETGQGHRHPLIGMPAGFARLLDKPRFWVPKVFWDYQTVPQAHLNGRTIPFPQGRILGGGSSINAMIYTRGQARDYDQWAQLGAVGWSYENVLPYFRKSENNVETKDKFHGDSGPLIVSRSLGSVEVTDRFVAAAVECGILHNPDFNGAVQEGVGLHHVTVRKGRRSSTASAYLGSTRHLKRLSVVSGAMAHRIVLEGTRAKGVEYSIREGSKLDYIEARQEVIVCAGAIGSPKLLMLSGIGPADHLRQHGLQVGCDLPGVGENLQDHFDCYVAARCNGRQTFPADCSPLTELTWLLRYMVSRQGPLASNFVEAGAFIKVDPASETPDTQFHMLPSLVLDPSRQPASGYGLSIYTNMLRPRSRGVVRLASSDPARLPLIDPRYLSDPYDRMLTREGLKVARDVLKAGPLSSVSKGELVPGPDVRSDADLDAFIRQVGKTDFHPAGTCRMGTDDMTVVDPELRVRGVSNLRVADASVMPSLISGNTNAPTIMIAEKAADLILKSQPVSLTPASTDLTA